MATQVLKHSSLAPFPHSEGQMGAPCSLLVLLGML